MLRTIHWENAVSQGCWEETIMSIELERELVGETKLPKCMDWNYCGMLQVQNYSNTTENLIEENRRYGANEQELKE